MGTVWTYHPQDYMWECTCGEAYQFMEGGPTENRYKYCPGCGRQIIALVDRREGGEDGEHDLP